MAATPFEETLGKTRSHVLLSQSRGKISQLMLTTHFSRQELEKLFLMHHKIAEESGPMARNIFQQFCHASLGITDDAHFDQIYQQMDTDRMGKITAELWAINLSVLLRGTLSEKIKFVWKVYSHNNVIKREIINRHLKKAIPGDASVENMRKDLGMMLLQKLDCDGDGMVSFKDFQKAVGDEPLLLECLGQCLPRPQAAATFLAAINGKPVNVTIHPIRSPTSKAKKLTRTFPWKSHQ